MSSLWYDGEIAEAVTRAKKIGAIFLVFIEGRNDLSQRYGKLFYNEEILKLLRTPNFVAIKIEENSTAHQQFGCIYPHNTVPSIYFIGKNGRPVETVTNSIEVDDLKLIIHRAIEEQCTNQGLSFKTEQESDENSSETSVNSNEAAVQSTKLITSEEKVLNARESIEQKKEEKRKQAEKEERLKEIDRRKTGQNVQQMKKWQREEELKQIMDERQKEKRANQAARDRVLAQIEEDKAERTAKFHKQTTRSPQASRHANHSEGDEVNSNITKLQFRLPDGSSHIFEFQMNDSLEMVHQHIQNEMKIPFATYTLSTTFPRREFVIRDNSQSLLDLHLHPNAVVLILPHSHAAGDSNKTWFIGKVFWWLLAPVFSFYDFIVGYFSSTLPISKSAESSKRPAPDTVESNRYQTKRQAMDSTIIKRQGNIHRLSDRPGADDDNNTWNGNSTQQM